MYNIETLANAIERAVDSITKHYDGCIALKLADGICLVVGWSNSFDPGDTNVIHCPFYLPMGIVASIKHWNPDIVRNVRYADQFDPLYYNCDDIYKDEICIRPEDDYAWIAGQFLNAVDLLRKYYRVDSTGKLISR